MQIGRDSKGEVVSLQTSVKNIPGGIFAGLYFYKLNQIIKKNTKTQLKPGKLIRWNLFGVWYLNPG